MLTVVTPQGRLRVHCRVFATHDRTKRLCITEIGCNSVGCKVQNFIIGDRDRLYVDEAKEIGVFAGCGTGGR